MCVKGTVGSLFVGVASVSGLTRLSAELSNQAFPSTVIMLLVCHTAR